MHSKATTVTQYLSELPEDRRATVEAVRNVILQHLPDGYEEGMQYGMIGYYIPLKDYPNTYNGQPLGIASLASQKNHLSLYLMCVYMDATLLMQLKNGFQDAGLKLNMGKSCIRFTSADALPLHVIGKIIADVPPNKYIALYEESRRA